MKILLAVDFSHASEVAVNEMESRSWPPGTTLEVINVLDTVHLGEPPPMQEPMTGLETVVPIFDPELIEKLKQRSEETVRGVTARLGATGVVLEGDPKAAITDHAEKIGADFVVVGSHDPKGIERFFLGSVARSVVRHAHCSVEVVRAAVGKDAPRKILLATDGSDSAEWAARSVAGRPWPAGTEVRIFSAVELSLNTFQATLEPPFLNTETMELLREQAMGRAQNAIAWAEHFVSDAGLKTSESISVLVESPKQTIIDEAKNWGADLIVVGSHGRRGVDRFLLGSVSEAVATHAGCSVEVIRKGG
jgi:nucleotide-binding universal stress UspA family protein